MIGTAEVISIGHARRSRATTARCTCPRTSSSRRRGTSSTTQIVELVAAGSSASGGRDRASPHLRPPLVAAAAAAACASSARTPSSTTSASRAPGISRSDRRRFAASLLDAILGGSASSRLFQEIREKRGMAYAVYSFVSQYTDTGQIGVYLGTREDNLGDALAIAAEQIADIAAGNLPRDELERAKENLRAASCSRWSRRRRG